MAKTLQFRRLSTAALANTVGANGELIVDSSNGTISVHNGTTSGGKRLATETYVVNTASQLITAAVPTRLGQLTNDFGYITSSASISGGSATAIRLFTPRFINGVAFDGTANITISTANATESLAQSAFTQANTASNTASSAQANTITLQGVNLTQNTNITAAAQTVPQNAQTSNYVLQLTDAGKHIYYTQANNTTLHIPTTSNVTFSNGTTIMIVSRTSSSANVTVSPNTGVTMYLAGNTTSASRNVTTYGMATLIQVASNTWFINGTGVA